MAHLLVIMDQVHLSKLLFSILTGKFMTGKLKVKRMDAQTVEYSGGLASAGLCVKGSEDARLYCQQP